MKQLDEYLKEYPDFWLNPEEANIDNNTQRDLPNNKDTVIVPEEAPNPEEASIDNNTQGDLPNSKDTVIVPEEAPYLPWVRLSHIVSIYSRRHLFCVVCYMDQQLSSHFDFSNSNI